MRRRGVIALLGTVVVWPLSVYAQRSTRVPRIGYLFSLTKSESVHLWEACRQGLRELGYVEGKTILLEPRWAEGRYERLPGILTELAGLEVDVLVIAATPGNLAARAGGGAIPVVFVAVADPFKAGLIAGLPRPGGRFTGLSLLTPELSGKRLELLAHSLGKAALVVVLWNPDNPGNVGFVEETDLAARKLGLGLRYFEVRKPDDLEPALKAAVAGGAGALLAFDDPVIHSARARIVALAAKHRLPAMYGTREFADEGGLMSYGPHRPDLYRRSAGYVDKILKGAKPADLPVQQPTRFDLVVNMKTAAALGLTIPPMVLALATEVIK